jgi:phage portal protein BeeE
VIILNLLKEIRSQFTEIFGKKEPTINQSPGVAYQMLNSWQNYFTDSPKDLYLNPTVRTCIDCISKNFAKVEILDMGKYWSWEALIHL